MIRIFTSKTQSFGEKGEKEAVVFLMKQGFRIVDRNISNKFGEIDIVAKKSSTTYFFEVKTGKKGGSISPAENLHQSKIHKFLKSVEYYCFIKDIKDFRVQGIVLLFSEDKIESIETFDLV